MITKKVTSGKIHKFQHGILFKYCLLRCYLVPGQPVKVNLQTFGKSARLTWNPPLDPNGYIEGYTVYW